MKRLALVFVYLIAVAGFACLQAKNGTQIQFEQLPVKAQTTLNNSFAGLEPKKIYQKQDADGFTIYEVKLDGNTTIEFDMVGSWNYIKAKKNDIPNSVMPKKLMKTIEEDYQGKRVKYTENDGLNYTIQFKDGDVVKANAMGDIIEDNSKE